MQKTVKTKPLNFLFSLFFMFDIIPFNLQHMDNSFVQMLSYQKLRKTLLHCSKPEQQETKNLCSYPSTIKIAQTQLDSILISLQGIYFFSWILLKRDNSAKFHGLAQP